MATIQHLPVEIIAQIFFFVRARGGGYDNASLRALLSASWVCSYWRETALSTPRLWTFVELSPRKKCKSELDCPPIAARVQAHLDRSADASIDLYVNLWMFRSSEHQKFAWSLILPHLHRCRSLVLDGYINELPRDLADFIFPLAGSGPLNRLETLRMTTSRALEVERVFADDNTAPKLSDISCTNIVFASMPATSLTRLNLSHSGAVAWSYVLARLAPHPNLEHVSLNFRLENDEPPSQPLLLPNLKSLVVHDSPLDRYISAPNLERLDCSSFTGQINFESFPSLKHLSVHHAILRGLQQKHSSCSLPAVQRLDIINSSDVDFVLDLITSRPSSVDGAPFPFPSLQKLFLRSCWPYNTSEAKSKPRILKALAARPGLCIDIEESTSSPNGRVSTPAPKPQIISSDKMPITQPVEKAPVRSN